MRLNNIDKAEENIRKAMELDPKDVGIRAELQKIIKIQKEYELKQKKQWAGIFI